MRRGGGERFGGTCSCRARFWRHDAASVSSTRTASNAGTHTATTWGGGVADCGAMVNPGWRDCSCPAQQSSAVACSWQATCWARLQHAWRLAAEPSHPAHVTGALMLPVSIINRAAAIAFRTPSILAATDDFFTFPFEPRPASSPTASFAREQPEVLVTAESAPEDCTGSIPARTGGGIRRALRVTPQVRQQRRGPRLRRGRSWTTRARDRRARCFGKRR